MGTGAKVILIFLVVYLISRSGQGSTQATALSTSLDTGANGAFSSAASQVTSAAAATSSNAGGNGAVTGGNSGGSMGLSAPTSNQGTSSTNPGGNVTGGQTTAPAGDPGGDVDILARTIYGEARNQQNAAMQGVASVVMNRYNAGWAGSMSGVAGICQQPWQFSCWNSNDPNRAIIEAVQVDNAVFQRCLSIAQGAINGTLPDNTGGATMYHDTSISTPASWGNVTQTVQIGALIFFTSPTS